MAKYSKYYLAALILIIVASGCSEENLDPTQIGRFRPIPSVNVILDTLGVAEESSPIYENAEDPRPADAVAYDDDYIFSSGDIIRISIFELLQENAQYVDNYVVTESGNISIPEIGQIQAAGLTESQLEDEIRKALTPGILKTPSVTVSLMQSQSRVFTILGDGINNAGRYSIPRYDYRLMDALADAGSVRQFNVSYIYVTRRLTGDEPGFNSSGTDSATANKHSSDNELGSIDFQDYETPIREVPEDEDMLKMISPSMSTPEYNKLVISSAEMITDEELQALAVPEGFEPRTEQDEPEIFSSEPVTHYAADTKIEWKFKDGKWVPVKIQQQQVNQRQQAPEYEPEYIQQRPEPQPRQDVTKKDLPADYGWDQVDSAGVQARVIRIPKDKLFGGDPRYNIVIKPGDTISAQLDVVGEFYVGGNVNNQGIINLTGRPMTLKMAIMAAGGLGPLAWPKKCEVIRRIGENKEEIVMVDLEKIANGTQPDFFIKPNDAINVGTHGVARFMAVVRNAFRASYGFGFIYDRNFASTEHWPQI